MRDRDLYAKLLGIEAPWFVLHQLLAEVENPHDVAVLEPSADAGLLPDPPTLLLAPGVEHLDRYSSPHVTVARRVHARRPAPTHERVQMKTSAQLHEPPSSRRLAEVPD